MYKKERWGRVSLPAHASLRRGRGRGRRRGGNPNELRPLDATVEGVHPIPKFCSRMNGTRTYLSTEQRWTSTDQSEFIAPLLISCAAMILRAAAWDDANGNGEIAVARYVNWKAAHDVARDGRRRREKGSEAAVHAVPALVGVRGRRRSWF